MKSKNTFTVPKVKAYPADQNKDWYVWFRFNGIKKQIKFGLNKIQDLEERYFEAQNLAEVLLEKLQNGWIPNSGDDFTKSILRVADSMQYGYDKKLKSVKKNTADNFRTSVNFFNDGVKDLKIDKLNVVNFERTHAKRLLSHLQGKYNWKNKNYNKHLGYMRSMFFEVLDDEYIKDNPFDSLKNLKVEETEANEPPTDAEMALITAQLKEKNYGFYIFYLIIYYCGIRPNELVHLKIKHLDFINKEINLEAEFTKTSKNRSVPMLGNIYELLCDYKDKDPELYVFGTHVSTGGYQSRKNWFFPNKHKIKEDTPNRQWNELIKNKSTGLGINKSLYSAKHKGADDKKEAGLDIKTICAIFGHSEEKMTERYMKSLKKDRLNQAKNVQLKVF